MGKYQVLEEVAYVVGNKVVHHITPKPEVSIPDDVAKELGDKVRPYGESSPEPESSPRVVNPKGSEKK